MVSSQNPLQILNQKGKLRQVEPAVHLFPIQTPDDPIGSTLAVERGEVGGD